MRNKKKTVKWLTYATGVILFLMLGLAFLAPKLINSSLVKEKLLHDLSRKTGGTITFQALELSLFPVPRLIIKQAGLAIPQKIEATIASLTIYPQVRPLLRGQVKISKVQAQDPAITITLSDRKESKPWSIEEISAAIQALVGDSARLTVTVEKGRLSFRKPGQVPASLQQVEARMVVDSHKDRLRVTLEPFKVASPQIRLSALLSIQPSSPRLSLEIRGRGLAVGPLRDLALFVAEEMPSVQNVCDILRDGQVPTLSFHSRGDSFEALGAPRNLEIKGDLEGGRIYVPGPGLDFTAVYGQYLISKGILQGTNLTGQYGNSDLKQTSLNLSLIEDDAPLHLEGLVRADLGEVLTLLPRFVKDKVFLDELSKVQSLSGTARGRLALGGKIGSLNAQVMASDLNFSARYERIPFPITIQGGEFTYDEKQVSLKNLTGTLGQSTFSGLAARMDQGQTPHLTVLSGKMRLQAAEIYGWLSSLELLRPALKEFTAVSGTIALSEVALQGPFPVSKAWQFKTTGTAEILVIGSSSLPDSLTVRQGTFTLSPGQIVLKGFQANMLDLAATVSGSLMFSSEGLKGSDVSLDAETGPRGMQWIKTAAGLPSVLRVQQRLSLTQSRLVTAEKGEVSFQGTLITKSGQTLGLDLRREKEKLKFVKLDIEDAVSRVSVTLGLPEKALDLTFSGRLDSATLAALMEFEQMPSGHLAGDFTAHIQQDRPTETMMRGRLSGEKILLPWKPGMPLHIDALSVNSVGSSINILSSRLRLADLTLSSKGMLTFGKDGLEVNLEVDADRIEWKSLEKIIEEEKLIEQTAKGEGFLGIPVHGQAKISVQEFVYDTFLIRPLQADISFSPSQAVADIRKASICGIPVQGRIDLAGREQTIDVRLAAHDEDLGPTMACLSDRQSDISGRFSLDGSLTMLQKGRPLLRGLEGSLSFQARDGRINQSVPLSRIFSLLTVSEYFRGLPDLRKEGFSYSTITINGDIHQGRLYLKEAIIDGHTMTIMANGTVDLIDRKTDITVLTSPFKTLDSMLKVVPVKKGDHPVPLISMAVKMTGDLKDPEVSAQPISGISRGLSSNMARILKAPIRIIEMLIPQKEK